MTLEGRKQTTTGTSPHALADFSPRQRAVLFCLATGRSISASARKLGVSRNCIYSFFSRPEFELALIEVHWQLAVSETVQLECFRFAERLMRAARRVLRRRKDGQALLQRLQTCCDELDRQLVARMPLLRLGDVFSDVESFESSGTCRIRPVVDRKRRTRRDERLSTLHNTLMQRLEGLEAKLAAEREEHEKYPPWAVEMLLKNLDQMRAENTRLTTRLALTGARHSGDG